MIHIDEDLQQDYLKDSVPKQLHIITEEDTPTKLDGINWYIGNYNGLWESGSLIPSYTTNIEKTEDGIHVLTGFLGSADIYNTYLSKSKYIYISFMLEFENVVTAPTKLGLKLGYDSTSSISYNDYLDDIDSWAVNNYVRLFGCIRNPGALSKINYAYLTIKGACKFTARCYALQIQSSDVYYDTLDFYDRLYDSGVMPYLGESAIRKGVDVSDLIHIHQPNIADITNANLDMEAFSLTENLCSEDKLKFGACESSYCEFTIKGRQENWKDRIVKPYSVTRDEIFRLSKVNWYLGGPSRTPDATYSFNGGGPASWTHGTTEHYLAPNLHFQEFEAFAKPVMAVKFKVQVVERGTSSTITPSFVHIGICIKYDTNQTREAWMWGDLNKYSFSDVSSDWVDFYSWIPLQEVTETGEYFPHTYEISKINLYFTDSTDTRYTDSDRFYFTIQAKEIQLCLCDAVYWDDFYEFDIQDCLNYWGIVVNQEYIESVTGRIPLGRFYVTDIQEEYDRAVRTLNITAYDALYKLEANAKDWCTSFMYLVCFSTESSMLKGGKAFVRQVFTSYWNAIVQAGIDSRDRHTETVIYSGAWDSGTIGSDDYTGSSNYPYQYRYIDLDVSSYSNKVFVIDLDMNEWNPDNYLCNQYAQSVDAAGRGWKNAQILIQTGTSSGKRYCVNSGDYFKLPDDVTTIRIWRPVYMGSSVNYISSDFTISNVDYEFDLTNADARLTYFNWATLNLCAYDSSVTIRDIIRSLLEVTGCFFTVDRWGNPQFKYCTKAGLYPSNTLYPANDLYPRGSAGASLLPMHYIKSRREDFTVQNIGKIQIVKQQRSNEAKSICEFEYIGDATAVNTYLIEDNIFYCHEDLEYGEDMAVDVLEVLQNMYSRISNLSYVPNLLNCVGLPWIETGDRIVVMTQTGGFESFIFERHLKGIQALKDEFESKGEEYTKAISKYEYTTTMT